MVVQMGRNISRAKLCTGYQGIPVIEVWLCSIVDARFMLKVCVWCVVFQQLEVDYTIGPPNTVARSSLELTPILRMFGVNETGKYTFPSWSTGQCLMLNTVCSFLLQTCIDLQDMINNNINQVSKHSLQTSRKTTANWTIGCCMAHQLIVLIEATAWGSWSSVCKFVHGMLYVRLLISAASQSSIAH